MAGSSAAGDGVYVYLDYAATSPLCPEAAKAMEPWMRPGADPGILLECGANPNSLHKPGRIAFRALEDARRRVAGAVNADRPSSIVFTSGATEADNAALRGLASKAREDRRRSGDSRKCAIVVSSIEHDAVLECARELGRDGFEIVRVDPDRDGFVEVRALEAALSRFDGDDSAVPVLASVQTANSEIGSIQPVEQLCACAHARGVLFHTDATQALGKIPVDVRAWGVDAASFSSHKVGGPRGIGALYLRPGTPFSASMRGGGQEGGRRSGTQDVCSAVGFAAACDSAVASLEDESERLRRIRDDLYAKLGSFDSIQPTVQVDPGSMDYLPNIVNVLFDGFDSNVLVARYDESGFAVSGGSACSSGSDGPSHVLKAIGVPSDEALGEVRISLGRFTAEDDASAFAKATIGVLRWGDGRRS